MHMNPSFASRSLRLIAAASLACGLATFGCTTDTMPGAGEPQRYAPSVGPTMPSSTPGSEGSRPLNPPMISSYTPSRAAVVVQHPNLDALAIAAANQGFRGRYLGTSDPSTPAYVQSPAVQTGQLINPALLVNPQITVNSSISSPPTPVATSGGSGFAGTVALPITGAASVPTTVTAASTVAANAAATQASAPAAVVAGNLGGFLNPTMSSGSTVSPTIASTPGVGNITSTPAGLTTTIGAPVGTSVTTSALNASAAGATGGIVISRTANGTISITNVPAAKPGAIRLK